MMPLKSDQLSDVEHAVVQDVEFLEFSEILYDIEVSDNHNFYAGSSDAIRLCLVHNCATDVVALLGIRKEQLARAEKMELGGKNYLPIFRNHMLNMMSDTCHQLSHLRADGSKTDRDYIRSLLEPDSKFRSEIKKLEEKFKTNKHAREANRRLLAESGMKAGSLFSNSKETWVFKLSKPSHRSTLFYDVMQLEVASQTKSGEPSTDKVFIKAYKGKYEEVDLYDEWAKTTKLLNTYIKGWYKILSSNEDAISDSTLRPDYSFYDVATGRLASKNPSLQVIPSRGPLAKIIKEAFKTSPGYLLIRFDYSAHEVRCWSIIAGDAVLANAFKAGQELRKQLIAERSKDVLAKIRAELKTKGDIHIQNVFRFFGKWVSKDDPLRDAIKAVVFGVLYGKSAKTLGEDIKKDEAYAQEIIDKMFNEFKDGARWTKGMKKYATENYYVFSPIGRRRNLYASLTGDKKIIARQIRRGSNAPIQGFASELGTKASRLILEAYYKDYSKFQKRLGLGPVWENRVRFNRIVHDASYYAVPYAMVLPFIHMLQWNATYGITKRMEEEFNLKFTIEPEIEMEFSSRDDKSYKWDWTLPNLIECLNKAVDDAEELNLLEGTREEVMATIMRPYYDKGIVKYLQKEYPLLGVKGLESQLLSADKDFKTYLKDLCKDTEAKMKSAKKQERTELNELYKKQREAAARFSAQLAKREELLG